jgi:hypothetical protein
MRDPNTILEAEAARNPAETRAVGDQIAGAFIQQWELNAALYRQYGGRIVFEQGGPEPLEAWRLFLEERQRRSELAFPRGAGDPRMAVSSVQVMPTLVQPPRMTES